ncbi:unnamed protein product [Victoria cruziana]
MVRKVAMDFWTRVSPEGLQRRRRGQGCNGVGGLRSCRLKARLQWFCRRGDSSDRGETFSPEGLMLMAFTSMASGHYTTAQDVW